MRTLNFILIVKLAHKRMQHWSNLYALFQEYSHSPDDVQVLDLIKEDLEEYESKLEQMGWWLVSPNHWVYTLKQYQDYIQAAERQLNLPVSDVIP